jgi:hypothetical protein
MNPVILNSLACPASAQSAILLSVFCRFSLPFDSFKNREHPLLPDCIKVGSVRLNTSWSPL